MAVDYRLSAYFKNVRQYNRTGDKLWLEMLETHSNDAATPGGRAARRFLNTLTDKGKSVDSG